MPSLHQRWSSCMKPICSLIHCASRGMNCACVSFVCFLLTDEEKYPWRIVPMQLPTYWDDPISTCIRKRVVQPHFHIHCLNSKKKYIENCYSPGVMSFIHFYYLRNESFLTLAVDWFTVFKDHLMLILSASCKKPTIAYLGVWNNLNWIRIHQNLQSQNLRVILLQKLRPDLLPNI